jgi:hypothetical protein
MRPLHKHLFTTAALIAGMASGVQAQFAEDALRFSQYNAFVGPRTMALGGTAVGRSDDYTALFANPAGLASIRDYELSIGFARNGVRNDALFKGITTRSDNNSTVMDNAGIVYPIPTTRGSLTFAMGFGRVANFTSTASFSGFNAGSSIVRSLAPVTDLYSLTVDEERDLLRSNIPYQIWLADTSAGYLFPVLTDSVQQEGTVYEGGGRQPLVLRRSSRCGSEPIAWVFVEFRLRVIFIRSRVCGNRCRQRLCQHVRVSLQLRPVHLR